MNTPAASPHKKISADAFLKTFKAQWDNVYSISRQSVNAAYDQDGLWTQFMLQDGGKIIDKAFLEKVVDQLNEKCCGNQSKFKREWYTVDALIVSGENLYKDELSYPSEILTIIEHENQWDIETEMWKLIHWRAPLKVLIFYREKLADMIFTTENSHMPKTLPQMLQSVQAFWPEPMETEYLFINGYKDDTKTINWKFCIFKPGEIPLAFDHLV